MVAYLKEPFYYSRKAKKKILEKLGKIPKFSSHFTVRANLYSRKTF